MLSAPLLAVGFVAGIVISLAQMLTSIQDSAVQCRSAAGGFPRRIPSLHAVDAEKNDAYMVDLITGDLARYAR